MHLHVDHSQTIENIPELHSLLTRFNVSQASLQNVCSDHLFLILTAKIQSFEFSAPYFGLTQPEIEELRHDDITTERSRILQMLWHWKRKNGTDATYLAIVGIFLQMNCKWLAEVMLQHCKEPIVVAKYCNWEAMSSIEKQQVKDALFSKQYRTRAKYGGLVLNILNSFERRNIPVNRLKFFIISYTEITSPEFLNAHTIEDVFLIICRHYSSWFNIRLLKDMVEKFGSEDDIREVKAYEEDELIPYLQRSMFEIRSKSFPGNETKPVFILLPRDVISTGTHMAILEHISQYLDIKDESLCLISYDDV